MAGPCCNGLNGGSKNEASLNYEIVIGLECCICGEGILGLKIIHHLQGCVNDFELFKAWRKRNGQL